MRNYFYIVKYYIFSPDWRRGFFIHLLAVYGVLWSVTEPIPVFYEDTKPFFSAIGGWFYLVGFVVAFLWCRPKTVFGYQLNNRDVTIEIRIADAFKVLGDLVVPTNTTFDTDLDGNIPTANSIQGEFTRRYYDSEVHHLDLDIEKALAKENYASDKLPQKKSGKNRQYPIGTVIQLKKADRLFYLVANSHINDGRRAITNIENVKESLVKLWLYINEKGAKDEIVIPLVGTGKGKVMEKREDIILEIIRSFIASCSSGNYCDKLTIAIYPPDVTKHKINLNNLQDFLKYSCRYTNFDDSDGNDSDISDSGAFDGERVVDEVESIN